MFLSPFLLFMVAYLMADVPKPSELQNKQISHIYASDSTTELARIVPADGNRQEGILRVRGGSSLVYKKQFGDHVYSPRTRR